VLYYFSSAPDAVEIVLNSIKDCVIMSSGSKPGATRKRSPPRLRDPTTSAAQRVGPTHLNPREPRFPTNAQRPQEQWLEEAKQNLLRCQRQFFNQVYDLENVEKELGQALRDTRTGTEEEKREIRRWALDQHIAEVLRRYRDPERRRDILDSQMLALLSVQNDDGGDNMWVLMGFEQFHTAIEEQKTEIASLEKARAQRDRDRERERVAAGLRVLDAARERAARAARQRTTPPPRMPGRTIITGPPPRAPRKETG